MLVVEPGPCLAAFEACYPKLAAPGDALKDQVPLPDNTWAHHLAVKGDNQLQLATCSKASPRRLSDRQTVQHAVDETNVS